MAQIIDMEERRKPRVGSYSGRERSLESLMLDQQVYVDQWITPATDIWRSWLTSWGSLWLAPFGLRISPVEPPPLPEPKDRAGPG